MYLSLLNGWVYRIWAELVFTTHPDDLATPLDKDEEQWVVCDLDICAFNKLRGVELVPLIGGERALQPIE